MNRTLIGCGAASVVLALTPGVRADVDWSEDFEAYTVGSDIVGQGGWEFWGGAGSSPGARVTDVMVHGGAKALTITGNASSALQDDVIYQYAYTSGIWDYSTWQFVPGDATGGQTSFILLNQYDGGGAGTNWSTQLVVDPDAGTIESQWLGTAQPFTKGQWNLIRVRINLDVDDMQVYLNDDLIDQRLWTEGNFASGSGILQLAALDLYGSTGPYTSYYDDFMIEDVPPIGACCLLDGTCLPDTAEVDCLAMPDVNEYQGHGSTCSAADCLEYGDSGWIVTGPFDFAGDTTRFEAQCAFGSNDERFEVTIPYAGPWTFSMCTDTTFDTYLAIGTTPCAEDVAFDDDGCGVQSTVTLDLEPGVVYVTATSLFGEEGPFRLIVDAPCVAAYEPVGAPEGESCGEDTNGGCNLTTPAFEPINLGQTKSGTVWIDAAGTRDTDWYQYTNLDGNLRWAFVGNQRVGDVIECSGDYTDYDVTLTQASEGADTVMEVSGESVIIFGMISDGTDPSTDCAVASVISPSFQTNPCAGDITVSGVIEAGAACSPTNGDTNDDGIVDVSDLLNVLADWGCAGDPGSCLGDVNCDGFTNVSDLLDVLANWS